jgi:hypothetical protein
LAGAFSFINFWKGLLFAAREEEVDDRTTKGEEPNDEAPNDFLADGPVLFNQAQESEYGKEKINNAENGKRAIGAATTYHKQ